MTTRKISPYEPPAEAERNLTPQSPESSGESLSTTGLLLSLFALSGPVVVCSLAMFRIIDVPWDSSLVPLTTLFVGLAISILALFVAVVARVNYRTKMATFAILVSILAIPVTLGATWLLAMIGLANHPV